MFWRKTVLPVRGGAVISPRWPLPSGATRSMIRADRSLPVGFSSFHAEPLVGIERRQVVEVDLVAGVFGVLEVDRVDLEQREIALPVLRAANLAFHRVAGAQRKSSNLRR